VAIMTAVEEEESATEGPPETAEEGARGSEIAGEDVID
jgi:hypothetical protein